MVCRFNTNLPKRVTLNLFQGLKEQGLQETLEDDETSLD